MTAEDELYAGKRHDTTLEDLGLEGYSLGLGGDMDEREFVYARTADWGSPMYSEGICCVYQVRTAEPIADETKVMTIEEILDERPPKMKQHDAVPSLRGQYLKVMECNVWTDEDDIDHVRPQTPSYWIPVEWVRQRVRYDDSAELHT